MTGPSAIAPCPITPARHACIIAALEGGDFPAMVALRNGIAPGTLNAWIMKGLDPEAPVEYREFADDVVRVEAEISKLLVDVVMDRALGRTRPPEEGMQRPNAEDAKWMLTRRFQFLWAMDAATGRVGGQSVAEVVSRRIEGIEAETKQEVRRILAELPAAAKGRARKAGFLVP
jgi:hypothetical protein